LVIFTQKTKLNLRKIKIQIKLEKNGKCKFKFNTYLLSFDFLEYLRDSVFWLADFVPKSNLLRKQIKLICQFIQKRLD